MNADSRFYVAGHRGMVGSSVVRCLRSRGYDNLILRTSEELDRTRQTDVERFFEKEKSDYIFLAAPPVGGIMANNTFRADFIVGRGEDIPIRELAVIVRRVVGYDGDVAFDPGMPDGAPAKRRDIGRIESLNRKAKIPLRKGIVTTYRWHLESLRPVGAARTTS